KMARQKEKTAVAEYNVLHKIKEGLESETPVRNLELDEDEQKIVHGLHLLTAKPVLYVTNVGEDEVTNVKDNEKVQEVKAYAEKEDAEVIVVSAKIEEEIAELDQEEIDVFLEEFSIDQSGLDQLIAATYNLLGLATYFTAGEQDVRAWTFTKGMKAQQAAGVIHTHFEKDFIRTQTVSDQDLAAEEQINQPGNNGRVHIEGEVYDVEHEQANTFRFNEE